MRGGVQSSDGIATISIGCYVNELQYEYDDGDEERDLVLEAQDKSNKPRRRKRVGTVECTKLKNNGGHKRNYTRLAKLK